MIALEQELNETVKVWPVASKVVSTIHTKTNYNKTVNLLDKLIDSVSEKSDPVKESLIDILGTLVKDYEDRNIPEPEGNLIGSLKYLMAEHGIQQRDLKEIGSQGVVSEIIKKRAPVAASMVANCSSWKYLSHAC